ncbi:hypothetical protein [Thermofilum pendens]|uniref:Uncharacterized protein n=1 Tax=Thermofilum pendens (strain DSM 2475 / Hrk 5) TaxID=368408 RepID=A1RX75_THEPD|nr:hypothetical protein [Thermofilum pendens]ABL77805.1 hypothetical protein Tpen_0396 [Thermofilum pendens Hrk 5]
MTVSVELSLECRIVLANRAEKLCRVVRDLVEAAGEGILLVDDELAVEIVEARRAAEYLLEALKDLEAEIGKGSVIALRFHRSRLA